MKPLERILLKLDSRGLLDNIDPNLGALVVGLLRRTGNFEFGIRLADKLFAKNRVSLLISFLENIYLCVCVRVCVCL